MAAGEGSTEPDDDPGRTPRNGDASAQTPIPTTRHESEEDEEEEEEEEEEPRLKYAPLTKQLSSVYRNGDATSAFLVAGDKLIIGTHNGNIHVLSLPTFQTLKYYHAHQASISAVSISPFPRLLPSIRPSVTRKTTTEPQNTPDRSSGLSGVSSVPKNSPKLQQQSVPNTPSNAIYIATSSIDGNVCIQSLLDPKDVQLRNFGRPVQAVALSPEYKNDRSYLSGGQAGNLALTTGGQAGKSANASTTSASAATSGWLGSIGLGSNTGTDKVLHTGEGIIGTIKWSLSGKYVLWVNEQGIKIMRTALHLDIADAAFEWKRMSHKNKPDETKWEDMAGVWKARAEWFDRDSLESEDDPQGANVELQGTNGSSQQPVKKSKPEEVVVGWGDAVWIFRVFAGGVGSGKDVGERKIGRVEMVSFLRTGCIVSGVALYTPNLLLVLAYIESEENSATQKAPNTPTRRGRQNALEPEVHLIDLKTHEEISADKLTVSRFENLSASDYHLGVLPPLMIPAELVQSGALGAIGSGLGTIGSGLYTGVGTAGQLTWDATKMTGQLTWDATKMTLDATMYPARMLGANRLFSSGESIRSGKTGEEKAASPKPTGYLTGSYLTGWIPGFGSSSQSKEVNDIATNLGMKIFICSPYDCIVAIRRNLADRLQWLMKMKHNEEAWNLLDQHPEAVGTTLEASEASSPATPSKASSTATGPVQQKVTTGLADFFADASSVSSPSNVKNFNSAAEKEKRRIGEHWLQQLVSEKEWSTASEVAGKVLSTTSRWEHWIWLFIRNKKINEITPVIPTLELTPPLPSLVYEVILGYYVSKDRVRFKELIDQWPSDLFEITSIVTGVENQLNEETKDSDDWRILQKCLAKLFLASGRYDDALRSYIRLQDADTALTMIKDHHLLQAVADNIPELVLLRVSSEQLKTAPADVLEDLSSEPIKLLVDEAATGVVRPEEVVVQLEDSSNLLFLFFYLRALWKGEGSRPQPTARHRFGHQTKTTNLTADEHRALVDQFADTAVELFADYDRELLMEFLHTSSAYNFNRAIKVCERHNFVHEEVYLLSKTGETKKALFLIIDELQDVVQAIAFVKEQNDDDLWEDLLEYSMSRPDFISGLLAEVGTAINPISLVKRIPSGLEIEGLKDGLKKMIREYDLQDSISSGVAKVLQGEVAVVMEILRRGRRQGIKFNVNHKKGHETPELSQGHCAGCLEVFHDEEEDALVGFACGHVYHVAHLLHDPASSEPPSPPLMPRGRTTDEDESAPTWSRSVGSKVTNARLLKDKIAVMGGCRICRKAKDKQVEV